MAEIETNRKKVSAKTYKVVLENGDSFDIDEIHVDGEPIQACGLIHRYETAGENDVLDIGGVFLQKKKIAYIQSIPCEDEDGNEKRGLICVDSQSNIRKIANEVTSSIAGAILASQHIAHDMFGDEDWDDDDEWYDDDDDPDDDDEDDGSYAEIEQFMMAIAEEEDTSGADIINRTLEKFPDEFRALRNLIHFAKIDDNWSPWLAENCGEIAATAFAFGCSMLRHILIEGISQMNDGCKPEESVLNDRMLLPEKIVAGSDITFFTHLVQTLDHYIERARAGEDMTPRSVAEKILLLASGDYALKTIDITLRTFPNMPYFPAAYSLFGASKEYKKLDPFGNLYTWIDEIIADDDPVFEIFDDEGNNECSIPRENWFDNLFSMEEGDD